MEVMSLCYTYCVLFQDVNERAWFTEKYESIVAENLNNEEKIHIAKLMLQSQVRNIYLYDRDFIKH